MTIIIEDDNIEDYKEQRIYVQGYLNEYDKENPNKYRNGFFIGKCLNTKYCIAVVKRNQWDQNIRKYKDSYFVIQAKWIKKDQVYKEQQMDNIFNLTCSVHDLKLIIKANELVNKLKILE